jgi:hypothetical protein
MNGQLLTGILMVILCLIIQCAVVWATLRQLYKFEKNGMLYRRSWVAVFVLTVVTLIIFAGNLGQVTLWAALFLYLGEFDTFMAAFYHSVVNFSTLGYGDIVMSEEKRLLGGLEALNGTLMIGLSTGTMFSVLNAIMSNAWNKRNH